MALPNSQASNFVEWQRVSDASEECFVYDTGKMWGYFTAAPSICFKARVSTEPLIWKWFFIFKQMKLISGLKITEIYNASFGSSVLNVLGVIYLTNLTGQKRYVTELKWIWPVIVSTDSPEIDLRWPPFWKWGFLELEIGSLTATACKKSFTGSRQDTADINSRDFRSAELRALLNELTVRWSMMLSRNSLF